MVVLCGLWQRGDCGTIWDWAGQLGESGEYHMGRMRVDCFHVRSSNGGSPRLCQLRTASVWPWGTSIDYVLVHMGLWHPTNLVASTVAELVNTLHFLIDVHWDNVWATHGCPSRLSCVRHALGWCMTWPDSLIVIVKGGHSWILREPGVTCCLVISLARLYIDSNLCDTLRYGWGLLDVFKRSNGTSLLLIWELWGWNWLPCSQGLIIINYWFCYLYMFSIGWKPTHVNQLN
jgi:hypothetical protein